MKRGTVSIAVGEGYVDDVFDQALAQFSHMYPDITFGLTVGSTEHVLHQVTSEQAHLGLAYNVPPNPQVRIEASAMHPLVAVVKQGGRHDGPAPLTLLDLSQMPCAVSPKSFGIGAMIAAVEAKQGVRLRAVIETDSIAALKAFVRNDMGCAILPRFVVQSQLSDHSFAARTIDTKGLPVGRSSLLCKEGRKLPQPAQLLVTHLRKASALN